MAKSLGAFLFVRNGELYDYPYKEVITSLCEFCDEVVVVGIRGSDSTIDNLFNLESELDNLSVYVFGDDVWESIQGKEKLSHVQNLAASFLKTDYQLLCQADEIVDPESYKWIRAAMEEGEEGYLCSRINLWGNWKTQLNVPHHRKPCSTEVNRLTKIGYESYDDGESIASPTSDKYLDKIKIWHVGFIRKREIHPAKIREMQGNIFRCGVDSKLEGMEVFDSTKWFTDADLIPIEGELPPLIQQWAKERE